MEACGSPLGPCCMEACGSPLGPCCMALLGFHKNSFSSKFVHFQILLLRNMFTSKSTLPNSLTSKSIPIKICWLPNPKSFRFKMCSLPNPLTSEFVHFQIHYLCTFKSTHFEICSLPIHSLPISFSAVIVAIAFRNLQN